MRLIKTILWVSTIVWMIHQPSQAEGKKNPEELKQKIKEAEEKYHELVNEYNKMHDEQHAESDILADIEPEEPTVPPAPSSTPQAAPPVVDAKLSLEQRVQALEQHVRKLEEQHVRKLEEQQRHHPVPLHSNVETPTMLAAHASQYHHAYDLYQKGKLDEALASFQAVIADPKDPMASRAYIHVGEIYLNQKTPDKALEAFDKALKSLKEPSLVLDAKLGKSDTLLQLKKGKDACGLIKSLKEEPNTTAQKKTPGQLICNRKVCVSFEASYFR